MGKPNDMIAFSVILVIIYIMGGLFTSMIIDLDDKRHKYPILSTIFWPICLIIYAIIGLHKLTKALASELRNLSKDISKHRRSKNEKY